MRKDKLTSSSGYVCFSQIASNPRYKKHFVIRVFKAENFSNDNFSTLSVKFVLFVAEYFPKYSKVLY